MRCVFLRDALHPQGSGGFPETLGLLGGRRCLGCVESCEQRGQVLKRDQLNGLGEAKLLAAGEDEEAGSTVLVGQDLQVAQEVRDALDLVQDRALWEPREKAPGRKRPCAGPDLGITRQDRWRLVALCVPRPYPLPSSNPRLHVDRSRSTGWCREDRFPRVLQAAYRIRTV